MTYDGKTAAAGDGLMDVVAVVTGTAWAAGPCPPPSASAAPPPPPEGRRTAVEVVPADSGGRGRGGRGREPSRLCAAEDEVVPLGTKMEWERVASPRLLLPPCA